MLSVLRNLLGSFASISSHSSGVHPWRSVCCMNSPASESSTSRDVSSLLPAFAASRSQPPFSSGVGSGSGAGPSSSLPEPAGSFGSSGAAASGAAASGSASPSAILSWA